MRSTYMVAGLLPPPVLDVDAAWPSDDPTFRRIPRVNVPVKHRGMGYGSELLRAVTADADLEGITLTLEPVSSGGLTADQLVAWYKRYGFRWEGAPWRSRMLRDPIPTGVEISKLSRGAARARGPLA